MMLPPLVKEVVSLNAFALLCERLNDYIDPEQVKKIEEAFLLADTAHQGQSRQTGEPYITHPIAVATILAEMRMDAQTIMAAILHDVLEDTAIQKQVLVDRFGKDVADLVDGVTKLTQISFDNHAVARAENLRKMIMAMARDIRVILVKLADRLHNMRTLESLSVTKRKRIARETLEIFAPIANRLGMHAFRIEFEELGFAALYPLRHRVLQNSVRTARGNRQEIMQTIDKEIRASLKRANIPSWTLWGREKHLYSIYKKMRDKHLSFSEIMDVYGFRVIVDKVDTCYRILGVLHNLYKPLTQRFKDYIAIPKVNGYQSLHTTLFGPYGVPIEVQVRTEEMHKMAEYGIAAHWFYKTLHPSSTDARSRASAWLKGILEIDKSSKNPLEFIENVKTDLFPDEVYVFTPKGNILELPRGATPVDFAYAIHSDIGNSCVATKLDRKLAPLNTPLSSGQQVEIITSQQAKPNPAWLDFVVTGKARSNIRHYLKKQHREESMVLGKRLLENALHDLRVTLEQIPEHHFYRAMQEFGLNTINDLYDEIGLGNRTALLVAKQLARNLTTLEDVNTIPQPLAIRGTEGIVVTYAKCCRPIPGDPIAGFLEVGHGLVVHAAACRVLTMLYGKQPEKHVALRWEAVVEGEFPVDLHIDILNRRGSLAELALAVADSESNIENISADESDKRYFAVNLTISAHSRTHLAKIFRRLRRAKNVVRVIRRRQM